MFEISWICRRRVIAALLLSGKEWEYLNIHHLGTEKINDNTIMEYQAVVKKI